MVQSDDRGGSWVHKPHIPSAYPKAVTSKASTGHLISTIDGIEMKTPKETRPCVGFFHGLGGGEGANTQHAQPPFTYPQQ
jgi:hypothetical protein